MRNIDRPDVKIVNGVARCNISDSHYLVPCRDKGIYNCPWCGELKVNKLELMYQKLIGEKCQ